MKHSWISCFSMLLQRANGTFVSFVFFDVITKNK